MHCSKRCKPTVNMRKNNHMLPGFMILPLRALHSQGISTASQDPPGTSSPRKSFALPGHFHHFTYKISYPQPKGSPAAKQPVWAQAHTTRSWELLFPTSNKTNLPPLLLGAHNSANTHGNNFRVTLVWSHHLLQIQRSVTSCSCAETYAPCQKVEIYLFLVHSCARIIDPRSGCNLWKLYFSVALGKESE